MRVTSFRREGANPSLSQVQLKRSGAYDAPTKFRHPIPSCRRPDSVVAPLCRGTSRRRRQSDVATILTSDGTPDDPLSPPRKFRDRLRKVFPQRLKFLRRSRGHQSTPQLWPREKRNLLSVSAAIILSHTRLLPCTAAGRCSSVSSGDTLPSSCNGNPAERR